MRRFSPGFLLLMLVLVCIALLGVWLLVCGITRPPFASVLSTAL